MQRTRIVTTLLSLALAVSSQSPYILVVPGATPSTLRSELHDENGVLVLETVEVSSQHSIAAAVDSLSALLDSVRDPARRDLVGYADGSLGIIVRDQANRIAAFGTQTFTSHTSALSALNALPATLARAEVTLPNPASSMFKAFSTLTDESGTTTTSTTLYVVRLYTDTTSGLLGFTVVGTDGVEHYNSQSVFRTKADALAAVSAHIRAQADPAAFGPIVDHSTPQVPRPHQFKERWDSKNNPHILALKFGGEDGMVVNYTQIKENNWTRGIANAFAWGDMYWPTINDGLNFRWQSPGTTDSELDRLAPLEKYDAAFNGWIPEEGYFELVGYTSSECSWQQAAGKNCTWDEDFYSKRGPASSAYRGNEICRNHIDDSGNGIVDDAWPGSCEYTLSGVALLSTWFGICHKWVPASILQPEPQHAVVRQGPAGDIPFQVSDIKGLAMTLDYRSIFFGTRCNLHDVPRDRFGRIDHQACRNTNAGAFHVILVNLLAREGRSFAMDREYGAAVWNQPIVSFKSKEQAMYTGFEDACNWLGGCENVTDTDSWECRTYGICSHSGYGWNPDAVKWVAMETVVGWVVETSPSRRPNSRVPGVEGQEAVEYIYYYLLELDADDNIIGGEWRFDSPYGHPDFLFMPYDRDSSGVDGDWDHMSFSEIQALIDESVLVHNSTTLADAYTTFNHTFTERGAEEGFNPRTADIGHTNSSRMFPSQTVIQHTRLCVRVDRPMYQSVTVALSHGFSRAEWTIKIDSANSGDAEVSEFTVETYAFTNLWSSGRWTIEVSQGTEVRKPVALHSWTLAHSAKDSVVTVPPPVVLSGDELPDGFTLTTSQQPSPTSSPRPAPQTNAPAEISHVPTTLSSPAPSPSSLALSPSQTAQNSERLFPDGNDLILWGAVCGGVLFVAVVAVVLQRSRRSRTIGVTQLRVPLTSEPDVV